MGQLHPSAFGGQSWPALPPELFRAAAQDRASWHRLQPGHGPSQQVNHIDDDAVGMVTAKSSTIDAF